MGYNEFMFIFYGGAVLAVIMLVVSVILFFALGIPAVIGDLSGATARKAIENIRSQNENTGEKAYKSSAVNMERGRLTDKISPSGNLLKQPSDKLGLGMKTEKISTQRLSNEETAGETTVLDTSANETTVLYTESNETTVLSPDMAMGGNETTVLSPDMMTVGVGLGETSELPQISTVFVIEQDITFIHTEEIIV